MNPPFEQHAKTIFQLSPLKDEYKFEFSKEAMECCTSAIDIIQKIYDKTELAIQNREYHLISFHIKLFIKNFFYIKNGLDSTENGFLSPFMTFDNEKKEFVFIIRTNPCFGKYNFLFYLY